MVSFKYVGMDSRTCVGVMYYENEICPCYTQFRQNMPVFADSMNKRKVSNLESVISDLT